MTRPLHLPAISNRNKETMGKKTKVLVYDLSSDALVSAATAISAGITANVLTTNTLSGALELAVKEKPDVALVAEKVAMSSGVPVKNLIEEVSPGTAVLVVKEGTVFGLAANA
jgi:hypothetical protein